MDKLLNNKFMDLFRISDKEQKGRERIIYFSAIIALLKEIRHSIMKI